MAKRRPGDEKSTTADNDDQIVLKCRPLREHIAHEVGDDVSAIRVIAMIGAASSSINHPTWADRALSSHGRSLKPWMGGSLSSDIYGDRLTTTTVAGFGR